MGKKKSSEDGAFVKITDKVREVRRKCGHKLYGTPYTRKRNTIA